MKFQSRDWCLYGIFLFGQALQDGTMAMSAPLVASTLGERFSAAGMVIVFTTMGVAGCAQRFIVQRSSWYVQMTLEATFGVAGMVMCMLGANTFSTAAVLLGHVLIGLHRSGHVFMRFAPLELNPGSRGLHVMGRMCSFGVLAGIGGPSLAVNLHQHVTLNKDLGSSITKLSLAFGGLAVTGSLQLMFCLMLFLPASTQQEEPDQTDADAECSEAVEVSAEGRETAVPGRNVLCLLAGSLSWGLMLLVTVPFAAVSQSKGLSLVDAVYHLVLHDVMMWLPSSLTTRMITCIGAEVTLCIGIIEYACSFVLMYGAACLPAGPMQRLLVWAFILLLGNGWNQMWLAVTQLMKSESAYVQAFSESIVNFANVFFLLVTFAFSKPWKQAPLVAGVCLGTALAFMALARLRCMSSLGSRLVLPFRETGRAGEKLGEAPHESPSSQQDRSPGVPVVQTKTVASKGTVLSSRTPQSVVGRAATMHSARSSASHMTHQSMFLLTPCAMLASGLPSGFPSRSPRSLVEAAEVAASVDVVPSHSPDLVV